MLACKNYASPSLLCLVTALGIMVAHGPSAVGQSGSLLERSDAVTEVVEQLRGVGLKRPVRKGVKSKAELQAFVLAELDKELPEAKLNDLYLTYRKLGFVRSELNLRQVLVDVYTEQVAGFYNPERKELFLIDAHDQSQDVVMAHELCHAIQDQSFDLLPLQRAAEHNDDRLLALTSLIEGDASVAMMLYLMKAQMGRAVTPAQLPDLGRLMRMQSKMNGKGGSSALAKAPTVLSENMLFSYAEGAAFCQQLIKHSGTYEAIDRAFFDLPTSSEQILHPEKYFGQERDEPVRIELPPLAEALGVGWRVAYHNVLGEFNMRLLLGELLAGSVATTASGGWGGDSYAVLAGPDNQVVLAMVWVGDSATDALEFARAYEAFAKRRDTHPVLTVSVEGRTVRLIDGAKGEQSRLLASQLASATTSTGYDSTPGHELFVALSAPSNAEESGASGKRNLASKSWRSTWEHSSGQLTVLAQPLTAACASVAPNGESWTVRAQLRRNGKDWQIEEHSSLQSWRLTLDRGDTRYVVAVTAEAGALERAVAAIKNHNPRLASWVATLERSGAVEAEPNAKPAKPVRPREDSDGGVWF